MNEQASQTKEQSISVKEFLERVPPGKAVTVSDVVRVERTQGAKSTLLNFPTLQLHCDTELCNGVRFFDARDREIARISKLHQKFLTYYCRNCRKTQKTYALWITLNEDEQSGEIRKLGEVPAFGPPTPARVISLIGPEREYYLKGRRAETQGLGIAAFAYYRRVIENQKDRIFEEIIRVAEKLGADGAVLEDLRTAKAEIQFSKAVEEVKHGIPQALLINGHNPLTLLHSALSEGLHAQTDDQCLELATSIRVVLTDFVIRAADALKEEAELNYAERTIGDRPRLLGPSNRGLSPIF